MVSPLDLNIYIDEMNDIVVVENPNKESIYAYRYSNELSVIERLLAAGSTRKDWLDLSDDEIVAQTIANMLDSDENLKELLADYEYEVYRIDEVKE